MFLGIEKLQIGLEELHHAGKELRVIPFFPELRPHLEAVRAARAGSKSHYILRENYRRADANLRTPLRRVLERLGIQPWPKLFQNLRASRAIDLEQVADCYSASFGN
jgi:hypothetical protein